MSNHYLLIATAAVLAAVVLYSNYEATDNSTTKAKTNDTFPAQHGNMSDKTELDSTAGAVQAQIQNTKNNKTIVHQIEVSADTNSAAAVTPVEIATSAWTDALLKQQIDLLKSDQDLYLAVLDEFRNENDTARLKRLIVLLANFNGQDLINAAVDRLYSGDLPSQLAALTLLGRIQNGSSQARELLLDHLSTNTDTETLVAALNGFAKPGQASTDQKQRLQNQASSLASHYDPRVRRASISILARWSIGSNDTETLLSGLTDNDPTVRKTTAYALVNYRHINPQITETLLQRAEDSQETYRTRRGSIRALQTMPLDEQQQQRVDLAASQLQR